MCAVRMVHLCSNAQWICWWPQQNTFLMCADHMCAVCTAQLCSNAQCFCWWTQQDTFIMCADCMCSVCTAHLCSHAQWICWCPQHNTFLMCTDHRYVRCSYAISVQQWTMDLLVGTREHFNNFLTFGQIAFFNCE